MGGKKRLKDNGNLRTDGTFVDRVSVVEDLTNARVRLLKFVNELGQVDFAYARDSIIIAKMRNGRFEWVESADNLFKLGVVNVKFEDFYASLN